MKTPNPLKYKLHFQLQILLLTAGCCLIKQEVCAQFSEYFIQVEEASPISKSSAYRTPRAFSLYEIPNMAALTNDLLRSPKRGQSTTPNRILLPVGRDKMVSFRCLNTPILPDELQDKYPGIHSFTLLSEDGKMKAKVSLGHDGFHAMIMVQEGADIFIDPYRIEDDVYMVYEKGDYPRPEDAFKCLVEGHEEHVHEAPGSMERSLAGDCQLRQYRLAVACTGEYAQFHGGTVPQALSAINTSMTRVTGIYEAEVGVTFQLIPNNDDIIFLDASTDPYTNDDGFVMLGENQNTIDSIIGTANYDIGHVFSTGGGGIASLRSPCNSFRKARGVTGLGNPIGDPFDVDYVCHEIGHQFGGQHSYNNFCGGARSNNTAYEPGSGSTIMAYAGICPANVQSNSDPYFHAISVEEMGAFVTNTLTGGSCAVILNSANGQPTVSAGVDFTIPISTPFELVATGSDPDSDPLTYTWEQFDNEISTQPPVASSADGPNFRSFGPTAAPSRTFPTDGAASTQWEVLPSVSRTMNFRATVRDFSMTHGYGCTDEDDMVVTVSNAGGPLTLTAPNGGEFFAQGDTIQVQWDVNGTDAAPFNAMNVDILLSTDGGATFPLLVGNAVPNSGSFSFVTTPAMGALNARIRVKASGSIFLDTSDDNFEIEELLTCTTYVSTDVPVAIDPNLVATYTSNLQISDSVNIRKINVLNVAGTHSYVEDLIITLISPASERVTLLSSVCGNQDDFDLNFNDDSTNTLVCPPTGGQTIMPVDDLVAYIDDQAAGIWQLEVRDIFAQDGGALNSWSLEVCTSAIPDDCPPTLTLDGDVMSGVYSASTSIISSGTVSSSSVVLMQAPSTDLIPDFEVELGGDLTVTPGGCP